MGTRQATASKGDLARRTASFLSSVMGSRFAPISLLHVGTGDKAASTATCTASRAARRPRHRSYLTLLPPSAPLPPTGLLTLFA